MSHAHYTVLRNSKNGWLSALHRWRVVTQTDDKQMARGIFNAVTDQMRAGCVVLVVDSGISHVMAAVSASHGMKENVAQHHHVRLLSLIHKNNLAVKFSPSRLELEQSE